MEPTVLHNRQILKVIRDLRVVGSHHGVSNGGQVGYLVFPIVKSDYVPVFGDVVNLCFLREDHGEGVSVLGFSIRLEFDVHDVVNLCEDPLLRELLTNFIPICQVGAPLRVSGACLVFREVCRVGVSADEVGV